MASAAVSAQKALGLTNHSEAFAKAWEANSFPTIQRDYGKITPSRQGCFRDPEVRESFEGFAKAGVKRQLEYMRGNRDAETKDAVTATDVAGGSPQSPVPLVVDPEIISILKQEAPVVQRVPERGQDGFSAEYNRIDSRDAAIGFTNESDTLDMTNNNKKEISYARGSTDMEIWVDLVEISDFAAAGSEFYFNVRETTLGERVAQHAQEKERAMLYGDPSQSLSDGSPGDSNAYKGFAQIMEDNSRDIDKSSTDISGTDGLLKDIKAEIKSLLQSDNAINKSDLEIWTSHTLFDTLENEMEVRAKVDQNENSVNYGFETLTISGVDVFASHNIESHSFGGGSYTPGDPGDVFIMNRREVEFRSLMPLSTVPLARLGFGELVAMGEYGAPIMRGEGNLSRYLKAYNI